MYDRRDYYRVRQIPFFRKCFKKTTDYFLKLLFLFENTILPANTYIHNWPLQPFSQDYGLASHTHVVCVNFILELRDLQFNVDSEDFLRNFFMAALFTLRDFARNLLRENRRRNIFFIIFRSDA